MSRPHTTGLPSAAEAGIQVDPLYERIALLMATVAQGACGNPQSLENSCARRHVVPPGWLRVGGVHENLTRLRSSEHKLASGRATVGLL